MNEWKKRADGSWVRNYRLLTGNVQRIQGGDWSATLGSEIAVKGAGIHRTLEEAKAQVDAMAEARGLLP